MDTNAHMLSSVVSLPTPGVQCLVDNNGAATLGDNKIASFATAMITCDTTPTPCQEVLCHGTCQSNHLLLYLKRGSVLFQLSTKLTLARHVAMCGGAAFVKQCPHDSVKQGRGMGTHGLGTIATPHSFEPL